MHKHKVEGGIKAVFAAFIAFAIILFNCTSASAGFMDQETEDNKKEQQLLKKIHIIKEIFPSQIDEAALYATVAHHAMTINYAAESYNPEFDEEKYKKNWESFGTDIKSIGPSIVNIENLAALIGGAAECLKEGKVFDPECVLEKAVNMKVTDPKNQAEENVQTQIKQPQSIDLLTAATIIMLDSSGWFGSYSDDNFKKGLAGEGLVGNLAEGWLEKFIAVVFNGTFCTVGALVDVATGGEAVNLATIGFKPKASFTEDENFGVSTTASGKLSRYFTMIKICKRGYIGGTYSHVQNVDDKEQYQLMKDRTAEEIIQLAQRFRKGKAGGESAGGDIQNLIDFLGRMEGVSYCNYQGQGEGTGYVAKASNGESWPTTAFGITTWLSDFVAGKGYTNFNSDMHGGCVSKAQLDPIIPSVIDERFGGTVDAAASDYGLTLSSNERYALISVAYGGGVNHKTIIAAVAKYGKESEEVLTAFKNAFGRRDLCNGLLRRRLSEYEMFMTGNYKADAADYIGYQGCQKGMALTTSQIKTYWPSGQG